MIDDVTYERTTFASPPGRFEAGTPAIAQVLNSINEPPPLPITFKRASEEMIVLKFKRQLDLELPVTIFQGLECIVYRSMINN